MDEIAQLKQRIDLLENFMADFVYSDRYIAQKHMQFMNGKNIQLAKLNGTKIGTAADQKIGFYGKTPVVQASAITSPSGGLTVDGPARSAIDSIRVALTNIGITA